MKRKHAYREQRAEGALEERDGAVLGDKGKGRLNAEDSEEGRHQLPDDASLAVPASGVQGGLPGVAFLPRPPLLGRSSDQGRSGAEG